MAILLQQLGIHVCGLRRHSSAEVDLITGNQFKKGKQRSVWEERTLSVFFLNSVIWKTVAKFLIRMFSIAQTMMCPAEGIEINHWIWCHSYENKQYGEFSMRVSHILLTDTLLSVDRWRLSFVFHFTEFEHWISEAIKKKLFCLVLICYDLVWYICFQFMFCLPVSGCLRNLCKTAGWCLPESALSLLGVVCTHKLFHDGIRVVKKALMAIIIINLDKAVWQSQHLKADAELFVYIRIKSVNVPRS